MPRCSAAGKRSCRAAISWRDRGAILGGDSEKDLAKFGGPVHQGAGTGGLAGPADPRRKASLTRKRTLRKRLGAGGRAQSVGLFSVPLRFKYRDLQMVSRIRDRLDFAFLFADHQFPIVVKAPAHAHARFLIDPAGLPSLVLIARAICSRRSRTDCPSVAKRILQLKNARPSSHPVDTQSRCARFPVSCPRRTESPSPPLSGSPPSVANRSSTAQRGRARDRKKSRLGQKIYEDCLCIARFPRNFLPR